VLGDQDGLLDQSDLLHHTRWPRGLLKRAAAVGAAGEAIEPGLIDLVRRERRALVTRMARLCSDPALFAAARPGRFGLDDIRGRRLVGVGGILAQAGVFGRQGLDASPELLHQRFQLGDALAVGGVKALD